MRFVLNPRLDSCQLNAVQTVSQLQDNEVAKLEAVAGSGKTTTIIETIKELINQSKLELNNNVLLQFNKNIAEETQEKIVSNKLNNFIQSKTVHSIFFKASNEINKFFSKLRVRINSENFKATELTLRYVNDYCEKYNIDAEQKTLAFNVNDMSRLFDLVRLFAITDFDNSLEEIKFIIDRYSLQLSEVALNTVILMLNESYPKNFKDMKVFTKGKYNYQFWNGRTTIRTFSLNKNNNEEYMFIDFTDMLYLPYKYYSKLNDLIPTFEYIFVDEAQDLSKLDYALINLLKQNDSKIIFVGDSLQAINMFKGAVPELFNNLQANYTCELNYNYRSGKNIIEYVSQNTVCNNIKAGLNNEGIINPDYLTNIENKEVSKLDTLLSEIKTFSENKDSSETYLLLSEKNESLVNIYVGLLKANVKDISLKGLNDLLTVFNDLMQFEYPKLNIKPIQDSDTIETVLNTIQVKLNFQKKNLKDRFNFESENEFKKDSDYLNYSTLLYMVTELNTINEYKDKKALTLHLNKILNSYDTKNNLSKINIMTVHKAKGLESDIVTIINSTFEPKTFINKKTGKEVLPPQWMFEQMRNLKYVAYTRAKKQLNLVSIDFKQD